MLLWPFEVTLPAALVHTLISKKRPSKHVRNSVAGGGAKRSVYEVDPEECAPLTKAVQAAFRASVRSKRSGWRPPVNKLDYAFEPSQVFIDTRRVGGQHVHVDTAPALRKGHGIHANNPPPSTPLALSDEFSVMVSFGLDAPARIDLETVDGGRNTVEFPITKCIAHSDQSISWVVPCLAFNGFHAGWASDATHERRRLHFYCKPPRSGRDKRQTQHRKYSITSNSWEQLAQEHGEEALTPLLPTMHDVTQALGTRWKVVPSGEASVVVQEREKGKEKKVASASPSASAQKPTAARSKPLSTARPPVDTKTKTKTATPAPEPSASPPEPLFLIGPETRRTRVSTTDLVTVDAQFDRTFDGYHYTVVRKDGRYDVTLCCVRAPSNAKTVHRKGHFVSVPRTWLVRVGAPPAPKRARMA